MMPDNPVRRVWTRAELLDAAIADPQEQIMMKVAISPKLLLMLMDWQLERRGESCELVMAYGDPMACELRFFFRDEVDDDG
jgi:hypothetical protein